MTRKRRRRRALRENNDFFLVLFLFDVRTFHGLGEASFLDLAQLGVRGATRSQGSIEKLFPKNNYLHGQLRYYRSRPTAAGKDKMHGRKSIYSTALKLLAIFEFIIWSKQTREMGEFRT